jgi:crossover junction endodeoxyribonuclease RuvC
VKVLSIDPGYGRCGVAILEKERGAERVIYSACIETSSGRPFPERLAEVVDACILLMKTYSPNAVALERLFFSTNQKTGMHVAEVRGALIYAATHAQLPVFEYTPAQVKNATTGWGKSDKKAVTRLLKALLKIEKAIEHDDEFDAIAVGITHLAHSRK